MILSEASVAPICTMKQEPQEQSEEHDEGKKDFVNGVSVKNGLDRDESPRNNYTQGGRLKFFKDGKFILELERAREGERVSWVSVPRKTFWPPAGTASSTLSYRQESCTSLSASDDNSSIQSSPWQRDHSWKQTTPTKNISKQLVFYYKRPKNVRPACSRRKCRRPYDDQFVTNNSGKIVQKPKSNLLAIVQELTKKLTESAVSPRKRFLRDFEKESRSPVEECQKKLRGKKVSSTSSNNSSPVVSSYSINSLLADDKKKTSTPSVSTNSTTPQDRLYSENVDRLRLIDLSRPDKRLFSMYNPHRHHSPPSHAHPPFAPSPPYLPTHYYPFGSMLPPQFYYPTTIHPFPMNTLHTNHHHPARHESSPPVLWNSEFEGHADRGKNDSVTASEMPLNLSKHGTA